MALPSLMLDRVDEARLLLAESWRTSLPSYSNLTPCIPNLALPADRVRDNTATGQIGRLKTSLCGRELPRTPDVADRWDVAYLLDDLRPKLPPESHAAAMARDAGDVDDAAGLLGEHRRGDVLHAEENALDVGGENRVEGRHVDVGDADQRQAPAGVVDEAVDAAEARYRVGDPPIPPGACCGRDGSFRGGLDSAGLA